MKFLTNRFVGNFCPSCTHKEKGNQAKCGVD